MHGHDHGHDDGNGEQDYAARRHPEHVVLDIGGVMGALIVHTEGDLHGVEIEISRTGRDDQRSHKDVLEREIAGRAAYAAVFDKISEGTYTLWLGDAAVARDVVVMGGAISELDWSAHSSVPRYGQVSRAPSRLRGTRRTSRRSRNQPC